VEQAESNEESRFHTNRQRRGATLMSAIGRFEPFNLSSTGHGSCPGQSGHVFFLIFIKRLQSAIIMHRQTNIQVNQYLMLT
jgi:hypothetical protein